MCERAKHFVKRFLWQLGTVCVSLCVTGHLWPALTRSGGETGGPDHIGNDVRVAGLNICGVLLAERVCCFASAKFGRSVTCCSARGRAAHVFEAS